jgi:DNA repair photolyase
LFPWMYLLLYMKKIENMPISMSNSSDLYPPIERKYELTRSVLRIIQHYQHPVLIVTKSDLVRREMHILKM